MPLDPKNGVKNSSAITLFAHSKGSENKTSFSFGGQNLHLNIPSSAQTIGLNH
jgi:hypothetical protein